MFSLILVILLKICFFFFMLGVSLCIFAERELPFIFRIPLGLLAFLLALYYFTL